MLNIGLSFPIEVLNTSLNCLPGLDEGKEEELKGVELADDHPEADEDGGGGEPAFKDTEGAREGKLMPISFST